MDAAELKTEFSRLAQEWRAHRGISSSSTVIYNDPSYKKIIELGAPVVPLILEELEKELDHWFVALREITGENPGATAEVGNLRSFRDAWLEWGRQKGHLAEAEPV